ncbi:secreted RxLR effector protein 161-like [Lactuca sativa]|uniref:secreted RxLR effector protein 161-like n=1 Tax=Lactuca sativa TaxID=4236 RepID=UPI001C6890C1|nr:secreted RxLR effector protein 161-like [Lactuca sativa]
MEQNLKLEQSKDSPVVDASQCRRLIGRLLYVQDTRPDIAFLLNILSQFFSDPRQTHLNAVHQILRYLKATPGQGIFFPNGGGMNLATYCDADWLGCPATRRSRTVYLILLGGAPISWKTKKHSVVSHSSAEAEYRAMASSVSETLWLRWLLKHLGPPPIGPTPLFCDNQVAMHIANNHVFHEQTKHVEMDCHFVRERVESKEVRPTHVHTTHQVADLFTKALGSQRLHFLLSKLGIRNLHAPT